MIFDEFDSNRSQTIEALVPMVDLFAVLAIVFMIYAADEITVTKVESHEEIQKIVADIQVEREAMQQEMVEAEQARKERREFVANKVGKSLEQIEQEREQQAQQLVAQFTKMLAVQQSQAATEYEQLVTKYEVEHERKLEQEKTSLQQQKQDELNREKAVLEKELAQRKSTLDKEKQEALSLAKLEYEKELSSKEKVIEHTQEALVKAEQERLAQLSKQEAELEEQKRVAVAKVEQARQEESERIRQEKDTAIAKAEQERVEALSKADQERAEALAKADQERVEALSKADQERAAALAKAQQEQANALVMAASALAASKQQALAQAEQAREADLAAQKSALEQEKAKALDATEKEYAEKLGQQKELVAKVAEELVPYVEAQEAKKKIVDQLNENFREFDASAVEIDGKTGKVKLHFQESYFARGSHELSEDMKGFLRIMIPKYARSIYQNKDAAEHVESLKISGMTSPVYLGMYIDINGKNPRAEMAREFNMALSNKRAMAMYEFIFNEEEMGDYKYRSRLKADMGIAALGFQNAAPVRSDLIGKPADCIEYDCKQEQAAVLEFRLNTEE